MTKQNAAKGSLDPLIAEPHDETGPDIQQETIVSLPPECRVLVEAGPGTGKTHVACQRIAELINAGINPNRIWVISFTRTAITEFRNRIAAFLETETDAASVRIATLDSHAWAIQSGFSDQATLTGSYEDSIRSTVERILGDEEAGEYLERLQHLVVDEAQDIIGVRSELVLAMIAKLSASCGITAFADDAQAIYDFTLDKSGNATEALPARLRSLGFEHAKLTRIHRTDSRQLRELFSAVREKVLNGAEDAVQRSAEVRDDIKRLAHADAGNVSDLDLAAIPAGALVLMRRRIDVLERSSWNAAVPHRLRMSGLPARILPWISAILWDFTASVIAKKDFVSRWKTRVVDHTASCAPSTEEAWKQFYEAAGEPGDTVNIRRLRELLGRSAPPMIFCSSEFGNSGPIIGTIHASKGREADDVRLYLPPLNGKETDEETRVSFVGATRARKRLSVGETGIRFSGDTGSGRAWRIVSNGRIQVEIGRAQDLQAAGLVGKAAFPDQPQAQAVQDAWRTVPVRQELYAWQVRELDWAFVLFGPNEQRLCVLSEQFGEDVRQIAKMSKRWPPARNFPYIRSLGLRSLVLRPDDPELELLHDPWRQSGFLLAPLLTGFSSGKFGAKN